MFSLIIKTRLFPSRSGTGGRCVTSGHTVWPEKFSLNYSSKDKYCSHCLSINFVVFASFYTFSVWIGFSRLFWFLWFLWYSWLFQWFTCILSFFYFNVFLFSNLTLFLLIFFTFILKYFFLFSVAIVVFICGTFTSH